MVERRELRRVEMIRIAYVSRKAQGVEREELEEMLGRARRRNRSAGLTGVLLDSGSFFFQIVEGPREAVRSVLAAIERDRRHQDFCQLTGEEECQERAFADWSMGHFALYSEEARGSEPLESLNAYLRSFLEHGESEALRMLRDFVGCHGIEDGRAGETAFENFLVRWS